MPADHIANLKHSLSGSVNVMLMLYMISTLQNVEMTTKISVKLPSTPKPNQN